MRHYFKILSVFIVLTWLSFSYIHLELNLLEWNKQIRTSFIVFIGIWSIITPILLFFVYDITEYKE